MGVKVIDQYATLGLYDFINIVDAPDNETISKVSVDLCSRGTVEIMTLAAISIDSFISALKTGTKSRAKKSKPAKGKAQKKT